jgi:beta-aspartyl-peptidase (threonine type)
MQQQPNGIVIAASANGRIGLSAGMDVLRAGGSALDAVEVCTRMVEENPDDHSVGLSGLPNLVGEVELDASIMDGSTRAAGAVAALRGYPHPVSVARRVMTDLPHVLLAGAGAARFAAQCGFSAQELLTEDARRIWRERFAGILPEDSTAGDERYFARMREFVAALADPQHIAGTVNVIARDADGAIASAASTSGWAWKYPGRVSDSAVIGAGNYCDNLYGAATCTGRGEMASRCCTARSVVTHLENGAPLAIALQRAMGDLLRLPDAYASTLNILAMTRSGEVQAISNGESSFVFMDVSMASPREMPRTRMTERESEEGQQ